MHDKRWLSILLIFFISAFGHIGLAQDKPASGKTDTAPPPDYPSQQLLEFLADFGSVDEQTYELIEYHALQRDSKKPQEKSNDE